jgi:hypothetical protein
VLCPRRCHAWSTCGERVHNAFNYVRARWGILASTMTPQHHTGLAIPRFPKLYPHLHMCYSIRMHPYAHPQHSKVLKQFVYIQYGCGIQSMGVGSLNHDTTTSYRLSTQQYPIFSKLHPHLHSYYDYKEGCTHMPIHSISRC